MKFKFLYSWGEFHKLTNNKQRIKKVVGITVSLILFRDLVNLGELGNNRIVALIYAKRFIVIRLFILEISIFTYRVVVRMTGVVSEVGELVFR